MNLDPEKLKKLSDRVSIILVEPKYQGNVGAVARLLKNFGLRNLIIVNFEEFTDEALSRAMGGKEILLRAKRVETFEEAVKDFDIVAGTSSTITGNYKKFRRVPIVPDEFWESVSSRPGRIALVFGREVDGLRNEELEKCHYFLHIPANPEFPVLNLSHAVSVVLYDMIRNVDLVVTDLMRKANGFETEKMLDRIGLVLEKTGYPDYRLKNTTVMLRRIISRSDLTDMEFYKIMGIIRGILHAIDPGSENE
ncbi:hypothetical protein IX51_11755 [uncultured archaeon]|nr:hypothetical protein IX51_11755 [uncultured archaeon]